MSTWSMGQGVRQLDVSGDNGIAAPTGQRRVINVDLVTSPVRITDTEAKLRLGAARALRRRIR